MSIKKWFIRRDDEEFGPFTPDEIRQRAAVGWLREIDFIRPDNKSAWIPATRVKDLKLGSAKAIQPTVKSPKKAQLPVASRGGVYVNEQGVLVSSTKYRVESAFSAIESDLNGYDSASIQENKPLFFGRPTYTVVLHGWGVDKYSPSLTHHDYDFVRRVVESLNIAIVHTIAKNGSSDLDSPPNIDEPDRRQFKVIAPLLSNEEHQFLILMLDLEAKLDSEAAYWFEYGMADAGQTCGKGPSFSISSLHDKLLDAGILQSDRRGRIGLTSFGEEFAEWLISNGYQAEYFASPLGGWGEQPANDFWDM